MQRQSYALVDRAGLASLGDVKVELDTDIANPVLAAFELSFPVFGPNFPRLGYDIGAGASASAVRPRNSGPRNDYIISPVAGVASTVIVQPVDIGAAVERALRVLRTDGGVSEVDVETRVVSKL